MILRWEYSIMKFEDHRGNIFKVTRRLPEMHISETRIFGDSRRAKEQLKAWLK
jgi:hypothetical protein